MMMLGGVPINVVMPPRIEPNETGISSMAGEMPALCAALIATGMSSARAPTLFMKPDSTAAIAGRSRTSQNGPSPLGTR